VAHEQGAAVERERADAIQRERAQHHARCATPGQDESTRADAGGIEDLHALAAVGRIGHRETAIERDVECARLDQLPVFRTDLYELARVSSGGADKKHCVAASVEDVVIAIRRLLEANRLAEEPNDIRRE